VQQDVAALRTSRHSFRGEQSSGRLVGRLDNDEDAAGEAELVGPAQAIEHVDPAVARQQAALRPGPEQRRQLSGAGDRRVQAGTVGQQAGVVRHDAYLAQVGHRGA